MLKEYSKIKKRSKKFKDLIKFVEDLSLFIKQVQKKKCKKESKKPTSSKDKKQKNNAFIKMCSL